MGQNVDRWLNFLREVQGDPARAGFQSAPTFGGARAILDFRDSKRANPGELPGGGGVIVNDINFSI